MSVIYDPKLMDEKIHANTLLVSTFWPYSLL
jgi:hypothetical protein